MEKSKIEKINEVPLVSVLCQAYNHGKYIEQCLSGIIMQKTSFPFEVLVHDDASTDNTADIIRTFEMQYPKLVKPIYQLENQYSQNKKVFSRIQLPRANGKYIAICEGDDYWTDPMKLQKQVDFLEQNPGFTICYHSLKIKKNGELLDDYVSHNIPLVTNIKNLTERNYIPTPSVVLKNRKINLPDWYFKCYATDYAFFMLNAQFGKIKKLPDVMAVYRIHQTNVWANLPGIETLKRDIYDKFLMAGHFSGEVNRTLKEKLINRFIAYAQNPQNINRNEEKALLFKMISAKTPELLLNKKVASFFSKVNSLEFEELFYGSFSIEKEVKDSTSFTPLVTVIIPNYNYAKYIDHCLQSVQDSDFDRTKIEIIVIDDASTDNSLEVIKKTMKNSRFEIRLIENHTNLGLCNCRNIGISKARGELLFFLDSDNYIKKDCINIFTETMIKNPDCSACYAPIQDFFDTTNEYCGIRSDKPFDYQRLLEGPYIDAMAMFRKSVFIELGKYSNQIPITGWEDFEMWLRLGMENKEVIFIQNEPLSFYRVHQYSMLANDNPKNYNIRLYALKKKYPLKLSFAKAETSYSFINHNNYFSELFYSDENGCFTETKSIKTEISDNPVEFCIPACAYFSKLRFNPVNEYAVVYLKSIKFFDDENEVFPIFKITSNATDLINSIYFFETKTPQIIFEFKSQTRISKILIDSKYLAIQQEPVSKLYRIHKESIKKLNVISDGFQKTFEKKNSEISKLKETESNLQNTIKLQGNQVMLLLEKTKKLEETIGTQISQERKYKEKTSKLQIRIKTQENKILQLNKEKQQYNSLYLETLGELIKIKYNPLIKRIMRVNSIIVIWLIPGILKKTVQKLKLKIQVNRLKQNKLFDREYYLSLYPEITTSGLLPEKHYLKYGWKEHLNPSKDFNTKFYLESNPDILASGINPLIHYIKRGKKENRLTKPV